MASPPPGYSARPALKIDLSAIKSNYNALQKLASQAKVAASVKADAYGLGIGPVGKTLYGAGCRIFFVATAGEGKALRAEIGDNSSIYVLNGPGQRDLNLMFGNNLKPVINSMEQARVWAEGTRGVKSAPFCAIHIDTGINRLGFDEADTAALIKNKPLQTALGIDHVMSHLACAPDASNPMNKLQLDKFRKASSGLPMVTKSLANTAGTYLGKPYHFQMVRPGIGLYGGAATTNPAQEKITPVATLLAPILQIRKVKQGDSIGYNGSFVADKDMRLATVAAGYADGIPVASSNPGGGGYATLHKTRLPIVGRVSMDLTIIDLSRLKERVNSGEMVTFRSDNLESDAHDSSTINYELLTRLGSRCRRSYTK